MAVKVVNKHTHSPTKKDIYIGRGSRWGNPYHIGKDGSRLTVLRLYKTYLRDSLMLRMFSREEVADLDGHNLVCFCSPRPCHGDILATFIERALNSEKDKWYED